MDTNTIGVFGTTLPAASTACAEKLNVPPVLTVSVRGLIRTPTALAPGPVYVIGMVTGAGGGGPPPGVAGTALTVTGPPLNTVSPAALTYLRFSASGSPVAGADAGRGTLSVSCSSDEPAGKFTIVSSATVPSGLFRMIRTRVNSTPLPPAA